MICVHDFPRGEVSVKVGVMEFGLNQEQLNENSSIWLRLNISQIGWYNTTDAQ